MFNVLCIGGSSSALTPNRLYLAQLVEGEPNLIRVKNNAKKWSKYSIKNFIPDIYDNGATAFYEEGNVTTDLLFRFILNNEEDTLRVSDELAVYKIVQSLAMFYAMSRVAFQAGLYDGAVESTVLTEDEFLHKTADMMGKFISKETPAWARVVNDTLQKASNLDGNYHDTSTGYAYNMVYTSMDMSIKLNRIPAGALARPGKAPASVTAHSAHYEEDFKTATPYAEAYAKLKDKEDPYKEEHTKPMKEEKEMEKVSMKDYLVSQKVPTETIKGIVEFRREHKFDNDELLDRVVKPQTLYRGGEVLNAAIMALLDGQNVLLQGSKATGKNVLCNVLSFLFGRPQWDVAFHVNMDAASLIGSETYKGGEVVFNPGALYECGLHGGFGVLDEINMAKNEAVAVLHSITDDRRLIDVPGYERLHLHPATRFIATMNHGYAGTRELNEALLSRFIIIHMPEPTGAEIEGILQAKVPSIKKDFLQYFAGVFTDLQSKAHNAEISTKSVDMRGIIAALRLIDRGMAPATAMVYCIVNKCFDEYERKIVQDVVNTRISKTWTAGALKG